MMTSSSINSLLAALIADNRSSIPECVPSQDNSFTVRVNAAQGHGSSQCPMFPQHSQTSVFTEKNDLG